MPRRPRAHLDGVPLQVASPGGKTPLSLFDTMEGYELVMATLYRIEYGVYA